MEERSQPYHPLHEEHKRPGHPIHTFKLENQVIRSLLNDEIDGLLDTIARKDWSYKERLIATLKDLRQIEKHYIRKEKLLFHTLEKYGIVEPAQVMWVVDDIIRKLIEKIIAYTKGQEVDFLCFFEEWSHLKDEIEEMIFKEEEIIFQVALEMFSLKDWEEIAEKSFAIGFAYIPDPYPWKPSPESIQIEQESEPKHCLLIQKNQEKTDEIVRELVQDVSVSTKPEALVETPRTEEVVFPTGILSVDQMIGIFNAVPVDITFFDAENRIHFYSGKPNPIFPRTKSTIGREVINTYPSKNMHMVNRILNDFKAGKKEQAEYWLDFDEQKIYIRYFAVLDAAGNYLGCLEISQDVTPVPAVPNEKLFFESYLKNEDDA